MTLPTKTRPSSPLLDPEAFDHMQRVGKMMAMSALFPEHLRKNVPMENAIANAVLVYNMASRLNEDPLTVAQNIYFINGRPGWSTSYMISKANQSGVFKNPIDWDVEGEGASLALTAHAEIAGTGKRVSFTCDMKMAKAENWTKNAKYQSMPELMLRYRSAAALIRLYCPEVMIGIPSQIELETGDMKDITPKAGVVEPVSHEPGTIAKTKAAKKPKADEGDVVDAEAVDPNPDQAQRLQNIYNAILDDLTDAPRAAEVVELYSEEIEKMKSLDPALHKSLLAEIEAHADQTEEVKG